MLIRSLDMATVRCWEARSGFMTVCGLWRIFELTYSLVQSYQYRHYWRCGKVTRFRSLRVQGRSLAEEKFNEGNSENPTLGHLNPHETMTQDALDMGPAGAWKVSWRSLQPAPTKMGGLVSFGSRSKISTTARGRGAMNGSTVSAKMPRREAGFRTLGAYGWTQAISHSP